jgi:D-alanine-D-alanine ligase
MGMDGTEDRTDLPVLLLHNLDLSWSAQEQAEAAKEACKLEAALQEVGHPVTGVTVVEPHLAPRLREFDPKEYVVFNWCEGLPGIPRSEARVARTLAAMHFAYTGSTARALDLTWDKPRVKMLLERRGIPSPGWQIFNDAGAETDGWDGYPAIVKPAYEHCSYGVSREAVVMTEDELRRRINYVIDTFHEPALVEDFIDGREFHVGVWGDGQLEMLPPAEMDFAFFDNVRDRLCTYDSKFSPGSEHYEKIQLRLPAPLGESESANLRRTLFRTYRATGCRDYARFDVRLRDDTFYVLDVNPNADISSDASLACAAEAAGYSFGQMASRLVNLAARRHPVFGPPPS